MIQATPKTSRYSGSLFIDRNHANLSEMAKNLVDQWQTGIDIAAFKSIAKEFLEELGSHFQHEEMFLKSAKFNGLDKHSAKHSEILNNFRELIKPETTSDSIQDFVWNAQTILFEHELMDDQEFWGELAPLDPEFNLLINWSPEYETGNESMDSHHEALASYINRIYSRATSENWKDLLEGELRHIKNYSEHHFAEEEKHLSDDNPNHKYHIENHQLLLSRLEIVINDVAENKYDLEDLFDFLKHWLIYHTTQMDMRDL
ncbi:MAG: hypothetical protein OQJ97_01975 [Rhodospirillales bacterium]|nr:hypothetical protein [Rhodospirillales bacterium]